MHISPIIKELYKKKNLTLEILADKIGMSYTGLSNALKNDDFKISQIEKIAEVLDISINYFFNNENYSNISTNTNIKNQKIIFDFIKEHKAFDTLSLSGYLENIIISLLKDNEYFNNIIKNKLKIENLMDYYKFEIEVEPTIYNNSFLKNDFDKIKSNGIEFIIKNYSYVALLEIVIKSEKEKFNKEEMDINLKNIRDQFYDIIYKENSILIILEQENILDKKFIAMIASDVWKFTLFNTKGIFK